ncbi:flagellar hook protein FlgE [Thalassospira lucentensis]|uniref:flagellar hook protein FlgE n=1 Tax=Thalassospira lucentensis TaxID=168935 RepID=UPI002942CDD0|nr:flagellar hook protein FlgE [Thalassospira lucentensis]WOI12741.1 flagellar hook protein FlgE [Thalassospira lucentensis]
MSLSSALNSAVLGLNAQSTSLGVISGNISNSETVGYKDSSTSFSSLVTTPGSTSTGYSNGVTTSTQTNISSQGLIQADDTATSLAISGDGFFVVTDANGDVYYTRAGDFDTDSEGNLVNSSGYYLMGYALDDDGNPASGTVPTSTSALTTINLEELTGTAEATTEVSMVANLPADAAVGDVFSVDVEVFDSLGTSHTVTYTYEKTAANEWELTYSDPVLTSDGTTVTGTSSGGPLTITFDGDGNLSAITDAGNTDVTDSATLTITGWTTGANDSTIVSDLGTAGDDDGLQQFASDEEDGDMTLYSVGQNGSNYSEIAEISISDDGVVSVTYENGESEPVYQIVLADFANADGLTAYSDTVYKESNTSGSYVLKTPGDGGTGTLADYSLESSTVDTTSQFSKMIIAQQAYSAAAQVVSTTSDMYDTLISAVN